MVGLVLVVGYSYRFELRDVGDRVLAELVPGHVGRRTAARVEIGARQRRRLSRSPRRSTARASPMVLDTGASSVVLTHDDAKAAGLPLEVLNYTVNIDTANGRTRAAPVTLDRIAVGGLVERSVPALIAQPGQLKTSLLGMSFLNRLQSWEVRGDRLVLRGYPVDRQALSSIRPAQIRLDRQKAHRDQQQEQAERDFELRRDSRCASRAP